MTPGTIFRGSTPGELTGPLILQFLFKDVPYGPTSFLKEFVPVWRVWRHDRLRHLAQRPERLSRSRPAVPDGPRGERALHQQQPRAVGIPARRFQLAGLHQRVAHPEYIRTERAVAEQSVSVEPQPVGTGNVRRRRVHRHDRARLSRRASRLLVPEVGRAPQGSAGGVRRRDSQHEDDDGALRHPSGDFEFARPRDDSSAVRQLRWRRIGEQPGASSCLRATRRSPEPARRC